MVVFSQISFARNFDLGIRKHNLLVVYGNGLLNLDGRAGFVQRLKSNPGILDVAMTEAIPSAPTASDWRQPNCPVIRT